MELFGGEKHTAKSYNKAVFDADHAQHVYDVQETVPGTLGHPAQEIYDHLIKNRDEAKKRVEKLYGKGRAEANALNEEYDRLVARAMGAVKAVEDFEKEKLGMSEGE